MSCNNDCGKLKVENDQVICKDCGKNYGHLIDILDHARLRWQAEEKLAEAQTEITRVGKERKNISKGAEKNSRVTQIAHKKWWNLIAFMDDTYDKNWREKWYAWQEKTGRLLDKVTEFECGEVKKLKEELAEAKTRNARLHKEIMDACRLASLADSDCCSYHRDAIGAIRDAMVRDVLKAK